MKINKYFSIILLFSSLLILSNCIYASEIENNEANNNQLGNTLDNDNTEYTTVTTTSQFRTVFEKVGESTNKTHVIDLKQNTYKLTGFQGSITTDIDKDITLNGNNSIIDGSGQRSFLTVPKNVKLTINNVTITNTYKTYGSAITNSGTIILNNVIFDNNTARTTDSTLGGGAIFNEGHAKIINCSFINNHEDLKGSAIFIKENEKHNNSIYITNCTFSENNAQQGSTIHILGSTNTTIQNSTFSNDNSKGSVIFNENTNLTIDNCIFYNDDGSSIIDNCKNCIINNTLLYDNNNENLLINNNNLMIINSKISNNTAKTLISNSKNLTINNTLLDNNRINESMILNRIQEDNENYQLFIINSSIVNNSANQTCGVRNTYTKANTIIINSTWTNNTSLDDEGVIYDYYGSMNILDSNFYNNTSLDLFKGNINNFNSVRNNVYKGNYLKSYLNTTSTLNEDELTVYGTLKTDNIYNTTIKSGSIILSQNNNILSEENVDNNVFTITSTINKNELNELTLSYDGNSDFRDLFENLEVSIHTEEYNIEITNVTESYVYGDYISFDLKIKNEGNIHINNIQLNNIIPEELICIHSTEEFDNLNNQIIVSNLEINSTRIISFQCISLVYDNLELEFRIYNNKTNELYEFDKNITFIKPAISIERITAHPGEVINITARINNYNKATIDSIVFKFKYQEINNVSTRLENNILSIVNYNIADNLAKKDYYIEIICEDSNLEESFSNKSVISIIKYETYSLTSCNISDNYLNLKVDIFDENNENVNFGSVIIKINGKTIKTLKVTNGTVILSNYKVTSNYQNTFNISIIYSGNNKYQNHNNDTYIEESKKEVNLTLNYVITNDKIIISLNITDINGKIPESGYIAFKINNKTINSKIKVNENLEITYCLSEINIRSISATYYGNENYLEKTTLVSPL